MAAEYFLYTTKYKNTLIDRSKNSFAPLPPNTGEILIDYFIPTNQPLYLYKESGDTIILNNNDTIKEYNLNVGAPPTLDEYMTIGQYIDVTGGIYELLNVTPPTPQQLLSTGTTANTPTNLIVAILTGITAETSTKLNIGIFDSYSATTTAVIDTKIDKVSGVTGHLAIFKSDGNVEDSGVTIDSITGGSGYYLYIDKEITETTTSSTDVLYLSGGTELSGGVWSLDFNAIGGNTQANKWVGVSWHVDGVQVGVDNYFKTNDATTIMPFVLTKDITLTSGYHYFEIFFYANGGTSFLDYAAIRARIVN
jgi:hypothetical protein